MIVRLSTAARVVVPHLRDRRLGFTLTEMLAVCVVLLMLLTLLGGAVNKVRAHSEMQDCNARLRLVGHALATYKQDYFDYPAFAPPYGLGDRTNWYDLWGSTDVPGDYFFGATVMTVPTAGGSVQIMRGNATDAPRLPRLLTEYVDAVSGLHCPGRGPSAYWFDLGPYFYHATFFATDPQELWQAVADQEGFTGHEPLAACQSPMRAQDGYASWRHGEKHPGAEGGINYHLYTDQCVKPLVNPATWDAEPD